MKKADCGYFVQYSFWGNVEYATDEEAKFARNRLAKRFRDRGHTVTCSTLTNQCRPYNKLSEHDGAIGTVYKLDVYKERKKHESPHNDREG